MTYPPSSPGGEQRSDDPYEQPYGPGPYGQVPAQQPHGQPYGQAPAQSPYGAYPAGPYGQPNYPGGYGYGQPRGTNGMAIASMVLGILWIFWIGSILALIFGYVARSQLKRRNEQGGGMAIAGIVLGWIGAATLIFFIALGIFGASTHDSTCTDPNGYTYSC